MTKCRVCGYEGKFEEEEIIIDYDVDYNGDWDDFGNCKNHYCEDIRFTRRTLLICPECRIVYYPKE